MLHQLIPPSVHPTPRAAHSLTVAQSPPRLPRSDLNYYTQATVCSFCLAGHYTSSSPPRQGTQAPGETGTHLLSHSSAHITDHWEGTSEFFGGGNEKYFIVKCSAALESRYLSSSGWHTRPSIKHQAFLSLLQPWLLPPYCIKHLAVDLNKRPCCFASLCWGQLDNHTACIIMPTSIKAATTLTALTYLCLSGPTGI